MVMTMTETKTYKKTNTKTKTHRQRQIQSASKTQCMLSFFSKAGGASIQNILDKDKDKDTFLCILGVNIFQG